MIRAGAEGDVTLALAPGQPPVVHADLDGFAFAVSAIASAVAVLDAVETRLGKTVSATWQAIDRGTCETNLAATVKGAPTLDFDALRRLASDAFGCAVQVPTGGIRVRGIGRLDHRLCLRGHRPSSLLGSGTRPDCHRRSRPPADANNALI